MLLKKIFIFFLFCCPFFASADTTVGVELASTTSPTTNFTIPVLPPGLSCTYALGVGTVAGVITLSGVSGLCNTNDFLSPGTVTAFKNPISANFYTGYIIADGERYVINPFEWTGTSWNVPFSDFQSGFNSTYSTKFTDVDIVGTSTVSVTASFFIDPLEVNRTISEFNPTLIDFSFANRLDGPDFVTYSVSIGTTTGNSSAVYSISTLTDGTYDLLLQFSNFGVPFGAPRPFEDAYVYVEFTIASGTLSNVGNIEFYDSTTFIPDESKYEPCGLTALSGCLNNSVRFLIVPSDLSLTNLFDNVENFETKFPFAYAYDFYDVTVGLYTASTTQSLSLSVPFANLGTTTLISKAQLEAVPFASLIKTILGYLIWLMFATLVYRKTLLIFNS